MAAGRSNPDGSSWHYLAGVAHRLARPRLGVILPWWRGSQHGERWPRPEDL